MQVQVLLLDYHGEEIATVEVARDILDEMGTVIYKGKYYNFQGHGGKFHATAVFGEIKTPVDITPKDATL